jgi:hypothetical protein
MQFWNYILQFTGRFEVRGFPFSLLEILKGRIERFFICVYS